MSESVRCFIAVKLPPEALEGLRPACERLRAAEQGWKWVDPGTFHVTLKFLGQVEAARLRPMWASASAAVRGQPAFRLALNGLGAFPNLRQPRVAWAGVTDGAQSLAELAARVDDACAQHGFERENRPFSAHLTLGRAREPGPSAALTAAVEEYAATEFGRGLIDRVFLMKSELTRGGARYTVLEEQALRHGEAA